MADLQHELSLLLDFLVSAHHYSALSGSCACPPSPAHAGGLQIFANSTWVKKPTPGAALLNLRYRDERRATLAAASSPAAVSNSAAAATPASQAKLDEARTACSFRLAHAACQMQARLWTVYVVHQAHAGACRPAESVQLG